MIACLSVSYFASAVERRDNADLKREPLIVGGQNWEPRPLFGYSREAALKGVAPGMSLRQAHVLSPGSRFLPAFISKYQGVAGEIVDMLTDFTHLVEPANMWQIPDQTKGFVTITARALPAQYYLDLETLPEGEATSLVQEIGRVVRKQTRLAPSAGLATDHFTAQVAAMVTRPSRLRPVAPDRERDFLAGQSITYLPLDTEIARRLRLLGIKTLGQFTALSRLAVQEQFGTEALSLYRMAHGETDAKPQTQQPEPDLQSARQFEPPLEDLLTLQSVLDHLAMELAEHLQNKRRAAGSLTLEVEDEQGARRMQQILRQPANSVSQLLLHLHNLLQQLPVTSPVTAAIITAGALTPMTARQLSLFAPTPTHKLERLLPAIMARYKSVDFYQPQPGDRTHPLPERRFQLQPL